MYVLGLERMQEIARRRITRDFTASEARKHFHLEPGDLVPDTAAIFGRRSS